MTLEITNASSPSTKPPSIFRRLSGRFRAEVCRDDAESSENLLPCLPVTTKLARTSWALHPSFSTTAASASPKSGLRRRHRAPGPLSHRSAPRRRRHGRGLRGHRHAIGRIALKTVIGDITRKPRTTLRFRREVQLARSVSNPHVVRIHELFLTEGSEGAFVTMEFLDGVTLADKIRESGPLPWREVRTVTLELCDALHCIHEAEIIHRDLKTRNIMLAATRRVHHHSSDGLWDCPPALPSFGRLLPRITMMEASLEPRTTWRPNSSKAKRLPRLPISMRLASSFTRS